MLNVDEALAQVLAHCTPREAVVITNDNPSGVRPSGPLAENALVLHRDTKTGKWRAWDIHLNDGEGGWSRTITSEQVATLLGGTTAK